MKSNTILYGALAVAALALIRRKPVSGMQDPEVSLDNIRRGVANGWYKATRTMVNGKPAVELSGRTQDGKLYTDVYPVSQETYNKLT